MNDLASLKSDEVSELKELLVVGQSLLEEKDNCKAKLSPDFETIRSCFLEVKLLKQLLQDQVKNDLQALQDELKEMEGKPDGETEGSEMIQQEQQLCQEHQSLRQNQQELSSQCESQQKEKEILLEEKENLSKEKERIENETTVNLPKRKEEVSLFINISRIRWEFEGSENDIRGCVSNKTDVKLFNFDKRKCSQFFMTNSVWDSMKEN